MKHLIFFIALAVGAADGPPASSNAQSLQGKRLCQSVMTATDGQMLVWSTASNCFTVTSATPGVGDVTGAASLSTGGLIAIAGATAGSVATDSGLAFNTTTKAVGIFGPIIGGQNSTYQGKLQLRGLTSGVSTLSADADGSGMTLDGNFTISGTFTAGATGANELTAITAPATPASGKVAYYADSTTKRLTAKDDAGFVTETMGVQNRTLTRSMTIFDPVAGDSGRVQMLFAHAVTITSISCSVKAATSATINLDERAFAIPDTAGTAVLTSDLACDTDGATSTTFSNAAIAANVPVALTIASVSGTPDTLRVFVTYTVDR